MLTIKAVLLDSVTLLVLSAAVIIPQWYLQVTQVNLDWTSFLISVALPILLACIFLAPRRRWAYLFAFLGMIWALTDDAPVYLDSVFTWPEATSGIQHVITEIILHLLTLGFFALALREALKAGARGGRRISRKRIFISSLLGLIAFILAYAQNIPFVSIEQIATQSWFELDIVEHIASVIVLFLAILIASRRTSNVAEGVGKAAPRSPVIDSDHRFS